MHDQAIAARHIRFYCENGGLYGRTLMRLLRRPLHNCTPYEKQLVADLRACATALEFAVLAQRQTELHWYEFTGEAADWLPLAKRIGTPFFRERISRIMQVYDRLASVTHRDHSLSLIEQVFDLHESRVQYVQHAPPPQNDLYDQAADDMLYSIRTQALIVPTLCRVIDAYTWKLYTLAMKYTLDYKTHMLPFLMDDIKRETGVTQEADVSDSQYSRATICALNNHEQTLRSS